MAHYSASHWDNKISELIFFQLIPRSSKHNLQQVIRGLPDGSTILQVGSYDRIKEREGEHKKA